jgi:6-pyruvoyltetrahydropterin/6-carboxytetrahydropterin synthase
MIEIELKEMFSAAHALRDYPGVCRRIHGHNWTVVVRLKAGRLDEQGMSIDYAVLKKILSEILSEFDHQLINDVPYFQTVNPTSERIAEYIFHELEKQLPPAVEMKWVKISETDQFSVIYKKSN